METSSSDVNPRRLEPGKWNAFDVVLWLCAWPWAIMRLIGRRKRWTRGQANWSGAGATLALIVLVGVASGPSTETAPKASAAAPKATPTAKPAASVKASDSAAEHASLSLTQGDIGDLLADPEGYKGASVDIVGKVFDVERDGSNLAFQIWTDPDGSDGNIVVYGFGDVDEDDYVRIKGHAGGKFTGENAFGADLTVPTIEADVIEPVDATALDPAIKTYRARQTQWLGGVKIAVRKVEISEKQTRVYVRYTNNSGDDFYGSPALVANGEEVESDYSLDGPKAPSDNVSPGASSTGVLTFERIEDPDASIRLTYDGYDDDYNDIKASFHYGG